MSILVYKQRFRHSNKKDTPGANYAHIRYIATRPRVLKNENMNHGLFGKLEPGAVTEFEDWKDVARLSYANSKKGILMYLDGNILYINVMNCLSVDCDCDCDGNPAEPDMHDIGILASFDPVVLDQACVDLVYGAEDGQSLIDRIESRNGLHTLEQAEKIGLGSREERSG